MSDINQKICDAVDLIVEKRLSQANFDKTIQAIVIEQGDLSKGEYKVKYLDSTFYAYDKSSTESQYEINTSVYVLVPENDFSKVKTILGRASADSAIDPVISENDTYEYITKNIILTNAEFGITSYKNETIVIYNKKQAENKITLDLNELKYGEKSHFEYFVLSSAIHTNLQKNQQAKGDYGIRVILDADIKQNKTNNNSAETPKQTTISFELNTTMMSGNPYQLYAPITQLSKFNIQNYENFVINKIELFSKNFNTPIEEEKYKPKEENIFFNNITLQCANKITRENLNSNYLYLSVPQGQYVSNEQKEISLKAIFQSKGKILDPKTHQGLQFFWFKKNPLITVESDEYCKIEGIVNEGWQCLNNYTVDEETQVKRWVAASDTQTIKFDDMPSNQQIYKCIALYNNIAYSAQRMIYNLNPDYNIEVTSDSGFIFYNNNGKPVLTCTCTQKEGESYRYSWYSTDINGYVQSLDDKDAATNTQRVDIANYPQKAYIDCVVEKMVNNTASFIGIGSVELLNLEDNSIQPYTVIINNGTQVFKYNTNGISPIHASKNNPNIQPSEEEIQMYLSPLTFTIINNKTGEEVTPANYKWILPKDDNNTMFDFSNIKKNIITDENGIRFYINPQLDFSIKKSYDIRKVDNIIKLEIYIDNQTYPVQTNILFLKEGDNGTNGTDYACQIVGMLSGNKEISFSDMIPFMINDNLCYCNSKQSLINKKISSLLSESNNCGLFLRLYKNGEIIKQNDIYNPSITWSILKQPYIKKDESTFEKNQLSYAIYLVSNASGLYLQRNLQASKDNNLSNIIILKAELSFKEDTKAKEQRIYATLPIAIITASDQNKAPVLEKNSGFFYVVYNADGVTPSYNNNGIFTIDTTNYPINDYSYNWEVIGSQLTKKFDETIPNQIKVIPNNYYYSEEFNNGIKCSIKTAKTDVEVASVIIPIHMYLNKYGHAAINNWDGNTVDIDKEGGIILSPQIGAGEKNADNSFTGMLMGTSLLKDGSKKEVGLMGLHKGERSFFLDANTGSATFGINGAGQIKIDPGSENNQAIIEGGTYKLEEEKGTGLQINLTTPSITYGNKNFIVDKDGIVTCKGANISGWFSAKCSYEEENDDGTSKTNSYEMAFQKNKSLINMTSEDDQGVKSETVIKPGYFKVGTSSSEDKYSQEETQYFEYSDGRATLRGDFNNKFGDGETGSGSVSFNANGILMSYKTKEDSSGIIEKFSLTHKSFGFGQYQNENQYKDDENVEIIFGDDLPTVTEDNIKYKLLSGITYTYDTGLSIVGKLTATSGIIGGWHINSNSISSADDSVVLYSDGRIYGRIMNEDNDSDDSDEGFLSQEDNFSRINITSQGFTSYLNTLSDNTTYTYKQIDTHSWVWDKYPGKKNLKYLVLIGKSTYPKEYVDYKGETKTKILHKEYYKVQNWKKASTISTKTNTKTNTKEVNIAALQDQTTINFQLAQDADRTLVGNKITFIRPISNNNNLGDIPDGPVKYGELQFPYKSRSSEESEPIQRTGTRISSRNIISQDYLLSTEAKFKLKTRQTDSLAKGINEILTPPDLVEYKDGTANGDITIDTIVETWKETKDSKEFTYTYNVEVKNKGTASEEVISLTRQDIKNGDEVVNKGYTINLKGF